jgi:FkbM family methyltransferase
MALKTRIRGVLRIFGHSLVSTVHERLDGVEAMLNHVQLQNDRLANTQAALLELARNLARLAAMEATIHQILEQNTHIAGTQTALLQSGVHLVENMGQLHRELTDIENRIAVELRDQATIKATLKALVSQLSEESSRAVAEENLRLLLARVDDFERDLATQVENLQFRLSDSLRANREVLETVSKDVETVRGNGASVASSLALLDPMARGAIDFLTNQSPRQVCVEVSDYFFGNPELGLLEFLYSFLPSRSVIDVGAHIGDVSEHLLNTGFEVYAFEPYPESYQRLKQRLGSHPAFRAFDMALGNLNGDLPMYTTRDASPDKRYQDTTVFHSLTRHGMPPDLIFEKSISVSIRKLGELTGEGLIPESASILKIDTEGYDLEVIRGMGDQRYPVVVVEFWDEGIPFATNGLLYTLDRMVKEMQQRGYWWYIVLYRVWGRNETAFFCNHNRPVPESWGNVVFFRDREIFSQAQAWCAAALPRTYFKSVQRQADS